MQAETAMRQQSRVNVGTDSMCEHHQNTFRFVVRLKNKMEDAREKRVLYSENFVELGG
jgi:hypothetical protein